MRTCLTRCAAAIAVALPLALHAQSGPWPQVEGAWVRGTVPGQQGTGAFMRITAPRAAKLVGVVTPVAAVAEVHEMKMEGEVMRMRPVAQVDLPAGRPVEFKPGGYHVMLMDLKQALKPGATVPLTLVFRDATGAEGRVQVQAPVAMLPPAAAAAHDAASRRQ